MIGVVIPAHDEQDHIGFCLQSLLRASRCPALDGEQVVLIVALDHCSDASAGIARQMGALLVQLDARNAGAARAAGAELALQLGVRWLAFTDADGVVAPDWLSAQLALRSEAVCGSVAVHEGGSFDDCMQSAQREPFELANQHPARVHGANLGMSADAYRRAGGFQALATGEDLALVEALERSGIPVAWSGVPRVVTSARRRYRDAAAISVALARGEIEASQVVSVAGAPAPLHAAAGQA